MISNIRTIQQFDDTDGNTRGIYELKIDDKPKVFARKNKNLFVVVHWLEKPELAKVRADVAEEFFKELVK